MLTGWGCSVSIIYLWMCRSGEAEAPELGDCLTRVTGGVEILFDWPARLFASQLNAETSCFACRRRHPLITSREEVGRKVGGYDERAGTSTLWQPRSKVVWKASLMGQSGQESS